MHCSACGRENAGVNSFCVGCGTVLSPYAPPRTAAVYETESFDGYAGFWKRVAASLLDGIFKLILSMVVGFVWGFFAGIIKPHNVASIASLGGGLLGLLSGWLYDTLLESSAEQATYGKRILGIKVTDLDGKRISFARANGRFFGKIVSSITLCIGYMMAGFTEKKQALHDMMASTLVVNTSER